MDNLYVYISRGNKRQKCKFFDKPTKISGYIPIYTQNGVRMGAKENSHWLPPFLHIFCNSRIFTDRATKFSDKDIVDLRYEMEIRYAYDL